MNRMLVPLSATRRKAANRRSTSGPGSEAVGSSSTSSGTGLPVSARARATAIAVRSDAASVDTMAAGVDLEPESLDGRLGAAALGAAVELADARLTALEAEVVGDVERVDEPEVLVHEAQPGAPGGDRRADVERHAGHLGDGARVGLVVAGEGLDERRLAAPVGADEGVDLAALDRDARRR